MRMRGAWRLIFTDMSALLLALVVSTYAVTRAREPAVEPATVGPLASIEPAAPGKVGGIADARGGLEGPPAEPLPPAGYLASLMARQLAQEIARGEVELAQRAELLVLRLPWRAERPAALHPPAFARIAHYLARFRGCAVVALPVTVGDGLVEALLHVREIGTALTRVAPEISTVALVRRENHLSSDGGLEIEIGCSRNDP